MFFCLYYILELYYAKTVRVDFVITFLCWKRKNVFFNILYSKNEKMYRMIGTRHIIIFLLQWFVTPSPITTQHKNKKNNRAPKITEYCQKLLIRYGHPNPEVFLWILAWLCELGRHNQNGLFSIIRMIWSSELKLQKNLGIIFSVQVLG